MKVMKSEILKISRRVGRLLFREKYHGKKWNLKDSASHSLKQAFGDHRAYDGT